jgi:hypothetical protein
MGADSSDLRLFFSLRESEHIESVWLGGSAATIGR